MTRASAFRDKYTKGNNHFRARVKQFGEFAIDKKDYEVW